MSEGQRIYFQGEARLKDGDLAGAQKVWRNLITVFDGVELEKPWVERAHKSLAKLVDEGMRADRWQSVHATLEKASDLAGRGNVAGAEKIWSAVEELYRGDPFADEILAEVKTARARSKKK